MRCHRPMMVARAKNTAIARMPNEIKSEYLSAALPKGEVTIQMANFKTVEYIYAKTVNKSGVKNQKSAFGV